MKLSNNQLEEAAYIFEKQNGNSNSEYERRIIFESDLLQFSTIELEIKIVDGLKNQIYVEENERVSAYWALSKIGNSKLISNFKEWLKSEVENNNSNAIFQLLIALDRLDEKAFHENRMSRYFDETELNLRDAIQYLKKG